MGCVPTYMFNFVVWEFVNVAKHACMRVVNRQHGLVSLRGCDFVSCLNGFAAALARVWFYTCDSAWLFAYA
jgi:hypothetical protein